MYIKGFNMNEIYKYCNREVCNLMAFMGDIVLECIGVVLHILIAYNEIAYIPYIAYFRFACVTIDKFVEPGECCKHGHIDEIILFILARCK